MARRSASVSAGCAMPGSGSIHGATMRNPVSGFCPIQALPGPSSPGLVFRLRPSTALCPSKVTSKKLPVMLASTFATQGTFFSRLAKPPSLKMSGCHGAAAYAHSLNASGWRTTFAPLARKRSFTSIIQASLEMTMASRPTGVSSTSRSCTGPKASERPDGRLSEVLGGVVVVLRRVRPEEGGDRAHRGSLRARRCAAAADQRRDQADVLGEDDEHGRRRGGIGGEEVARDVVDARLHEARAAREARVHERGHLVVEALVGGAVVDAHLVADGEHAHGHGRGRHGERKHGEQEEPGTRHGRRVYRRRPRRGRPTGPQVRKGEAEGESARAGRRSLGGAGPAPG